MKAGRALSAVAALLAFSAFGSSVAAAQGVQLFSVLTGNRQPAGGDPDGYGAAAITFHQGQICIAIVVNRLSKPTEFHIHPGRKGQKGGEPVIIFDPPFSGGPGSGSECRSISNQLSIQLKTKPQNYYLNVHTSQFGEGAIRGQLFRATGS